jgi:hypothetical protein
MPRPNFVLDPTGSRPIVLNRAGGQLRDRDRTARSLDASDATKHVAARYAQVCTRAPRGSVAACLSGLSWAMHGLVCGRVVRCAYSYGLPTLALCLLAAILHPGLLVGAVVLAGLMLTLSLLPEGHSLLQYAYMREAHRLLGCVVAARHPPPFVLVDDADSIDALGLLHLLRRRCARIIVCDATRQPSVYHDPCHSSSLSQSRTAGLGDSKGGEYGCENDGCWALLRVLERARSEGCAFTPGHGQRGDVESSVRDFELHAHRRVLTINVDYYQVVDTKPEPEATKTRPRLRFAKHGVIFLLKCRATGDARDADLAAALEHSQHSRAMGAGMSQRGVSGLIVSTSCLLGSLLASLMGGWAPRPVAALMGECVPPESRGKVRRFLARVRWCVEQLLQALPRCWASWSYMVSKPSMSEAHMSAYQTLGARAAREALSELQHCHAKMGYVPASSPRGGGASGHGAGCETIIAGAQEQGAPFALAPLPPPTTDHLLPTLETGIRDRGNRDGSSSSSLEATAGMPVVVLATDESWCLPSVSAPSIGTDSSDADSSCFKPVVNASADGAWQFALPPYPSLGRMPRERRQRAQEQFAESPPIFVPAHFGRRSDQEGSGHRSHSSVAAAGIPAANAVSGAHCPGLLLDEARGIDARGIDAWYSGEACGIDGKSCLAMPSPPPLHGVQLQDQLPGRAAESGAEIEHDSEGLFGSESSSYRYLRHSDGGTSTSSTQVSWSYATSIIPAVSLPGYDCGSHH